MTYTPDPTDVTNPNLGVSAGTASAEFIALKQYIQSFLGGYKSRNKLLNGAFLVNQINGTSPVVLTPSGSGGSIPYVADCWIGNNTSATGNVTCSFPDTTTATNYSFIQLVFDSNATSFNVSQRVEGQRVADLPSGSTITISGLIQVDSVATTPTFTLTLNALNAYNVFSSETTVFTEAVPITLQAATYVAFEVTGQLTGSATTGFHFIVGIAGATNRTISITNLQIEVNAFKTPFERKTYPEVLNDCRRFYQTAVVNTILDVAAASTYNAAITFPTPMWEVPSISFTNETVSPAGTTISATSITINGFTLVVNFSGASTSAQAYCNWIANALP